MKPFFTATLVLDLMFIGCLAWHDVQLRRLQDQHDAIDKAFMSLLVAVSDYNHIVAPKGLPQIGQREDGTISDFTHLVPHGEYQGERKRFEDLVQ